jgi:hypothetical protein
LYKMLDSLNDAHLWCIKEIIYFDNSAKLPRNCNKGGMYENVQKNS